jgi:hypothetical protein
MLVGDLAGTSALCDRAGMSGGGLRGGSPRRSRIAAAGIPAHLGSNGPLDERIRARHAAVHAVLEQSVGLVAPRWTTRSWNPDDGTPATGTFGPVLPSTTAGRPTRIADGVALLFRPQLLVGAVGLDTAGTPARWLPRRFAVREIGLGIGALTSCQGDADP